MSKLLIESFFPATLQWLRDSSVSGTFLLDDVLFPASAAETCLEATITMMNHNGTTTIRLPILGLAAIVGIGIGLRGFVCFLPSRQEQQHQNFYMSLAFLTFGIMNISGLFIHCLWEAPGDYSYPDSYPVFWACDVYMTGVSAICLLFASLEELLPKPFRHRRYPTENQQGTMSRLLLWSWILCQSLGVACILWFLFEPVSATVDRTTTGESMWRNLLFIPSRSHPLELWYLIPPLIAGPPVIFSMFFGGTNTSTSENGISWKFTSLYSMTFGQYLFVAGALTGGGIGIGLDWLWCKLFNGMFLDLMTTSTLMFIGCDMMFLGILLERPNRSKEKSH